MAAKWMTPAQAARRLKVSESTVWRLLRRAELASVKVSGRRRIPATAIDRAARVSSPVGGPQDLRPLTLDDALFGLAGRFRSDGRRPGATNKHVYLGGKR